SRMFLSGIQLCVISEHRFRLSLSSNVSIGEACRNDIVLAKTMTKVENFITVIGGKKADRRMSASESGNYYINSRLAIPVLNYIIDGGGTLFPENGYRFGNLTTERSEIRFFSVGVQIL
ncbi:MAG: hypothetical protein PF482_06930, partial [Desulfobacteraceae bacterium]|nr:hypothetical protein [Desulfobacteraceae bacterium]